MSDKTLKYAGPEEWQRNGYTGFWAAPSLEPKDGKVRSLGMFQTCRDGISLSMRQGIMGEAGEYGPLPTDKLRLMFLWRNNNDSQRANSTAWAERGINALQAMEKLAGWPLTRALEVKGAGTNTNDYGLYCRGSRRWLKTPYMVTLYILVMRMCKDSRIVGFKNFDGLEKLLSGLTNSSSCLVNDNNYVRNTLPYWRALLVGYPDLFEKKKITYYWSTDRLSNGNNGYGDGISNLCSGSTQFKEAYKALCETKARLEKSKN